MTDLEEMHDLAPVVNSLPGEPVPYYVASGEGLRFENGGQLWTIIGRSQDTGGLFDAAFVRGPRGAESADYNLPDYHHSYHVYEGSVQFWLPGQSRILVPGDSVQIPPGAPVSYRMLSHATKMLFYSAPGGALDALARSNLSTSRHIYSAKETTRPAVLPQTAQTCDLARVPAQDMWDEDLPAGMDPFFLRSLGGERRAGPETLDAYVVRGRNTGSRYFAVRSLCGVRPYIVRHFHQQHTENFTCLAGRIWLWVNGTEVLLTAGDFLHAPAGTIHSFAIGAYNTQMMGLLTPNIYEPFFEVTSLPTEDHVYSEGLIDPSIVEAGMAAHPELDVVVVGPPPERVHAPGL